MRIVDLLDPRSINLQGVSSGKEDILNKMVSLMAESGKINDVETYRKGVFAREEESTTGIGDGIAIPHCKSDAVSKPGLAAMVVPEGVDFDALDGEPVYLLFLIAAPNTADNVHLDVLSKLSVLLMDEDFSGNLRKAKTKEEFLGIIDAAETNADADKSSEKEESAAAGKKSAGKLLAVTGCPTGIAHTYMAAEAIEKQAKLMGYSIKVETRGASGAKNVFTDDEIAEADGIIVAADTNVPMERFNGKKLVEAPVSDGISKSEELIRKVLADDAPVYQAKGGGESASAKSSSSGGTGHQIYKHLMNGVSHMLPFVVGGGIMIALAFLLDDYSINPKTFGMNTPVAAWFKTIGGYAFSFMLPVLSGYIAMDIADRPGLIVGFVGGYIASIGSTFLDPTGASTIPAGFLGALLAGFVGGYLVLLLKKVFAPLPKVLDGVKPVLLYPLCGVLLIGLFMCAIDPLMGTINSGLTGMLNSMGSSSKILLGCIVAGMMSIDMGGPINKASYLFGTGMLAGQTEGGFMIMAAVMIGGMVAPIAIALATTLFKNKFTAEERKSGPVNYVMGLCFITEGAIPFAAADPLRVIPSCVVGSAIAGGLSMAFGCTLRAPHGGVFVFPTIGNVGGYVAALAIGSVAAAIMLGLLKKKVTE